MITLSINNPAPLQQQLAEGLAHERPQAAQEGTKIYEVVKSTERFLMLKPTDLSSAIKPVQEKQSDWDSTLIPLAGAAYINRNPRGTDGCWEFMSAVLQNVHGAAGSTKGPLTLNTLKAFTWTVDSGLKGYPAAKEATVSQIREEIQESQRQSERKVEPQKLEKLPSIAEQNFEDLEQLLEGTRNNSSERRIAKAFAEAKAQFFEMHDPVVAFEGTNGPSDPTLVFGIGIDHIHPNHPGNAEILKAHADTLKSLYEEQQIETAPIQPSTSQTQDFSFDFNSEAADV